VHTCCWMQRADSRSSQSTARGSVASSAGRSVCVMPWLPTSCPCCAIRLRRHTHAAVTRMRLHGANQTVGVLGAGRLRAHCSRAGLQR
jgi:hypothetical protein